MLPTENSPTGFIFSLRISKMTILEKHIQNPFLQRLIHLQLPNHAVSSTNRRGPAKVTHEGRGTSQAALFTTLPLINCVYSGAMKDGRRSANPLPRKIFSRGVIVIKSEGTHVKKRTENQIGLQKAKRKQPNAAVALCTGGRTTRKKLYINLLLRATTWFSKGLTWHAKPTGAEINKQTCSGPHTFTLSDPMPRPKGARVPLAPAQPLLWKGQRRWAGKGSRH